MAKTRIRFNQLRNVSGADADAGGPVNGIDGGNLRITNVAAPVEADDAVNLASLETVVAGVETLRNLLYFIDGGPVEGFSGAYKEVLPLGSPFPTSEIWWENPALTNKVVELLITRDAQQKPIVEVWNFYEDDGISVKITVTDTYSYVGAFTANITRVIA